MGKQQPAGVPARAEAHTAVQRPALDAGICADTNLGARPRVGRCISPRSKASLLARETVPKGKLWVSSCARTSQGSPVPGHRLWAPGRAGTSHRTGKPFSRPSWPAHTRPWADLCCSGFRATGRAEKRLGTLPFSLPASLGPFPAPRQ